MTSPGTGQTVLVVDDEDMVREVVVAHRPRHEGRSHYGVWNRLWKGLDDVKAVRWMWRNRMTWKATEREDA